MHRYYRPPVYVAPRYLPVYYVPRPGYWVPGRYYYDEPSLENWCGTWWVRPAH